MKILYNFSDTHRYEMGAYKLALQHYRADNYILIQSSMYALKKIDILLKQHEPDVRPYALRYCTNNNICWSNDGKKLVNNILQKLNLRNWNNDPICLWNGFYCNNLFINELFKDGLFDIIINTKNISCAFERILGTYISIKIKNINPLQNENNGKYFKKEWLRQTLPNI